MNFRKATENDISIIMEMITDDELGKQRENLKKPIPKEYINAFHKIKSDENQELIVVENENSEITGNNSFDFVLNKGYYTAEEIHKNQRKLLQQKSIQSKTIQNQKL